jgi:hypothetical protein
MWTSSLRTAIFVAALIEYLSNRTLISLSKVEDLLASQFLLPLTPHLG